MMNKDKKKVYIEEMKSFFNKTSSVFVTHYQGLSVKQIDELGSRIKQCYIELRMINLLWIRCSPKGCCCCRRFQPIFSPNASISVRTNHHH